MNSSDTNGNQGSYNQQQQPDSSAQAQPQGNAQKKNDTLLTVGAVIILVAIFLVLLTYELSVFHVGSSNESQSKANNQSALASYPSCAGFKVNTTANQGKQSVSGTCSWQGGDVSIYAAGGNSGYVSYVITSMSNGSAVASNSTNVRCLTYQQTIYLPSGAYNISIENGLGGGTCGQAMVQISSSTSGATTSGYTTSISSTTVGTTTQLQAKTYTYTGLQGGSSPTPSLQGSTIEYYQGNETAVLFYDGTSATIKLHPVSGFGSYAYSYNGTTDTKMGSITLRIIAITRTGDWFYAGFQTASELGTDEYLIANYSST